MSRQGVYLKGKLARPRVFRGVREELWGRNGNVGCASKAEREPTHAASSLGCRWRRSSLVQFVQIGVFFATFCTFQLPLIR